MIYPKNFELKTGFFKIRNLIKSKCSSQLGIDRADEMSFSTDFLHIRRQLSLAYEFKDICTFNKDFPQDNYFDSRASLKKISIANTYLNQQELFDLKRACDTLKNITLFFKRIKDDEYPTLRSLCEGIFLETPMIQAMMRVMDDNGEIRDTASPELKRIREDIRAKSASISAVVHRLLRTAKSQGWCDADAEVNMRDGKMLIPVSAGNKRKISGIICDESATGKTAFIEPLESIELNNAVRELEFQEKREIIKILLDCTERIRPYIPDLLLANDILSELDFARAKARLAIEMNADMPHLSDKPVLDMRVARHPILDYTLRAEGKKIVPLDIELNDIQRIIMISGPNAGGKSVCLKTVALVQFMHQCGLLTPISPNSTLGIFNDIFIDIGDEQSIENDLSTYSSHLTNMKQFLDHAGRNSLAFIDEFGSGTEPILGGAIAEAILDRLNNRKVKGVITTHYTNLKNYATVTEGISNGAMLYDNTNMKPLFVMETGKTGNSFAFEMAKRIGIDERLLKMAEEIAGRDHIDYERRMQEIEEEQRILKIKLNNANIREQNLIKQEEFYNTETEYTLSERKNILKATKTKLEEVLKSANKLIERTILDIKNAEAEKGKTREIRKEYNELSQQMLDQISEEDRKIDEKIEKIKRKQREKAERRAQKRLEKEQLIAKITPPKEIPLKAGDKVYLDDSQSEVQILDVKDGKALLQLGIMQTFVDVKRLKRVKKTPEQQKQQAQKPVVSVNITTEKKSGSFMFGLDVRGCRGDEAVEKVAKYLDEALASNQREIKILHGTGTGALRSMIRDYLNSQLIVLRCHDEKIELGGAGITVAELDY